MRNTLVVNLYGGPGTGKSTNAARLFAMLKDLGIETELVTEYAKDVVWEETIKLLEDQIWVFANQLRRIKRLQGKVDVVVTDSPLLLSCIYGTDYKLKELVIQEYSEMNNLDVFLTRVKPYSENGRLQTEDEAKSLDAAIGGVLDVYSNAGYLTVDGSVAGCHLLLKSILKSISKEGTCL